jgi:hypothetical protein
MYPSNDGLCWHCRLEKEALRRDESPYCQTSVHLCWTCAALWAVSRNRPDLEETYEERGREGFYRRHEPPKRLATPTTNALRAAVDADPLDFVSRLALADYCEERGDYAEAARQRLIAKALQRPNNLAGMCILKFRAVEPITWSARYYGRKVWVRLAGQIEPEWYVFYRGGERVPPESGPHEWMDCRPDGDYYAIHVTKSWAWNLWHDRPHLVTMEPGWTVAHRIASTHSLVLYMHPEDWPRFARPEKLAACA